MSFYHGNITEKIVRLFCLFFSIAASSQIHIGEGTLIFAVENSLDIKSDSKNISSENGHSEQIVYVSRGTIISGELSGKIVYTEQKEKSKKKEIPLAQINEKKPAETKETIRSNETKEKTNLRNSENTDSLISFTTVKFAALVPVPPPQNKHNGKTYLDRQDQTKDFIFYTNESKAECIHLIDCHAVTLTSRALRAPPLS